MTRLRSCPYCHDSSRVYLSRVKTLWDALAFVIMMRPVRCHSCMGRFYRPFFLDIPLAPPTRIKGGEPSEDDQDRRSA